MKKEQLYAAGEAIIPYSKYDEDEDELLRKNDIAEWAKAKEKPSYSATEVGADAAGSADSALKSAKAYSDNTYMQATGYTDQKIADLINGAPETLDTLKEIADAMAENESVVEALEAAVGSKASEAEFQSHDANKTIHITASERNDLMDILNPKFSQAETRENIASGDKLPVILSKIKKFFADLKTVAFSGKYDDLDGKPLSLKNPQALTFTGGATGSYDGSTPKTVAIPTAVKVIDNLKSTSTTDALSAAQGKALNDSLGGLSFGKDSNGNWGYKVGGADAVHPFNDGTLKLLWENQEPTKSFNAQTINIPELSQYKEVLIRSKYSRLIDGDASIYNRFKIEDSGYITNFSGSITESTNTHPVSRRSVSITPESVVFGSGNAGTVTNNNEYAVPISIYGVK